MGTIAEKLAYVKETKALIKSALIEKGQTVADTDTFRSYADKVLAIQGGGSGGSGEAVVWFVTFIGADGTELFKMPVLDGDDCKNPITHGDITTPTKESTAQYNYTYSGWSLTGGGAADSTVLKAVTEDKTVYAAFTESVRKYTVNFYDGETLLTSKQVEYGSSASYNATKDNYMLMGWNPEPSSVTEDMDCYAVWMESQEFSVASWDFITTAVNAGQAKNIWSIGDEKDITLTWDDGTTETCTLQIADFDEVGTESNGNPFMTLISKGLLSKSSYSMAINGYNYDSTSGYGILGSFLINTVKPALPSELQAAMKTVQLSYYTYYQSELCIPHKYNVGYGTIGGESSYYYLADKIGTYNYSPLFDSEESKRIKYTPDGTAQAWWLDGLGYNNQYSCYIKSDGDGYQERANSTNTKYVCIKLFV